MKALKIIKAILFGLIYGTNLFLAVCLWLCGQSGNIMLGILLIALYRPSLWFAPLWLTILCWLPTRPKRPAYQRIPRAPHDLRTSVRYLLHAFWKLVLITQYKNTPSLNRYGSLGVFFSYTELSVIIVSYISR